MPKVMISDKMSPLAAELLRARGLEVDETTGLDPDALAGRLAGCDGLIYVIDDYGMLTMAEASTKRYRRLAQARVIDDAHNSWGPMALVDGRLIVRDMSRMVCLNVAERGAGD